MSRRKHMVLMQTGLIKYDSMTRAIAECREVDELKNYRDKARALELYAQQAMNRKAEAQAAEIRIRAERACKLLIREEQANGQMATREDGADLSRGTTSKKTLADVGVSRDQSSKWGGLADLSDEEFEQRLSDRRERKEVPTTDGIIGKDPDITMIDKDAFTIGAALADVIDLKDLDVEKIIQTVSERHRQSLIDETGEAITILKNLEGRL